ncbi:hypothetical protein, partial [Viscerimonas tarda]
YTLLGSTVYGNTASSLAVNSSVAVSFDIAGFMALLPTSFEQFYLFINAYNSAGGAAPVYFYDETPGNGIAELIECNENDNVTGRLSFTTFDRIMCEGATEILKLPDTYSYKWYTTSTGGSALTTESGHDNWLSYTKNSDERSLLFAEIYTKGNLAGSPISSFRDTLFIYRTPDSLIWTGAYNADWHFSDNWQKPSTVTDNYPQANIPRKCTNVLIPDGLARYPDLQAGSPTLAAYTSYSEYAFAVCGNITINHGGELKQPDSLYYVQAFVDVTFNTNRWYMWSPPLKNLYPGDIYVNDKNPYLDDVYVFTKLFARANPQNGFLRADWTGNFITPVVDLVAGDGMRIWIDDKGADATAHTPYT